MQETRENLSSLITPTVNELVTHNPMMSSPELFAPYFQQMHDINKMLQSETIDEISTQSIFFEVRRTVCIDLLYEAMVKNREMEIRNTEMDMRLKKALAEVEVWKKATHDKTVTIHDLATKCLILKKKELRAKRVAEREFVEEAESSCGDNGDKVVDMARTMKSKRRRRLCQWRELL